MSSVLHSRASLQHAEQMLAEGQALLQANRSADALTCFLTALRTLPNMAAVYGLIGDALTDLGHFDKAVRSYRFAITIDKDQLGIWNNLGNTLRRQHAYMEAMGAYNEALRLAPRHPIVWKNLGSCFQYENQSDKAVQCMERACSLAPQSLSYAWYNARVLPITYESEDHLQKYRSRYKRELQKVADLSKHSPDPEAIWDAFHLHYQGQNDRELQEMHGQIIHQIMAHQYPKYVRPIPPKTQRTSPIRVGFASSMLTRHTISFLFGDWMSALAERGFEVYGYLVGTRPDTTTKKLAQSCAAFHVLPNDPSLSAEQIANDELDVLIYPELGMNRHLLKLAALRLAPLQAVTWGHPITTGLPTVDVFLSSDTMETTGAENHYTERLVRLPGLSLVMNNLPAPKFSRTKSDFGLPADKTLFLIPQSLFKLVPEHDWIYGEIAKRLPNAHFCFIANAAAQSTDGATKTVKDRLERAFESATSNEPRFTLLPGQSHDEFLALNACADVFLDAPGWSGGRTTLEALGCGLIPITCAGPMMRQRHTAAILTELGWPEWVAHSTEEYVELATRLGSDATLRERLKSELPNRIPRLLNRQDVSEALAAFCQTSRH